MNDIINIDGLEIFANHGVLKEENSLGQKFYISIKMILDLEKAGKSDDLLNTINYAEVCDFTNKFVKENTYKLIETVAEKLAEKLLERYELIKEITISVKKPWAPIGYPIDCVSVEITRGWHQVYLSIGSNMGDKKENLDYAVRRLNELTCVKKLVVSDYITTKPYGVTEQDDFMNAAIGMMTTLSPYELLDCLHEIENERGRERKVHWGPRTLDLDILLYDDIINEDKNLIIPHIDMTNRQFVLEPLAKIAPYAIHPIKRMTVAEMLYAIQQS